MSTLPARLPRPQVADFAVALLLRQQGVAPRQIHELVAQLQAVRKALECRRIGCEASASATPAGGVRFDMEAMDAGRP